MIIQRLYWQNLIESAWQKRNIVWLMGVRRVGKTSLCRSLQDIEFFDCELKEVRELLSDPTMFLQTKRDKRLAIDEIHRLDNPSELLKIAADYYPDIKIVATGSSTLGASAKFADTLTGRKREVWLTPLLMHELKLFHNTNIQHRFLFGGFPSFFTEKEIPEYEFTEWIDAYWAKDVQELFNVTKRSSFQKFTELLLVNSGGMFEASRYTIPCEISRETITNYLNVLEETFVIHIIRPFSSHKTTEIVKAPKVYGFDTGFVCHAKGWTQMRQEDLGFMWEHFVLNEIHGAMQSRKINYWRDKSSHEIDFVIKNRVGGALTAIECKFSALSFDESSLTALGKNFIAFRESYPDGLNIVVAYNIDKPYTRTYKDLVISFVDITTLIEMLRI